MHMKSQESLQQAMEFTYRVWDQMLEHAREFFHGITVTTDQLDHFQYVLGEDVEDGLGVLDSNVDV